MLKKKYLAQLKDRGVMFDSLISNSIKEIKKWARGRGDHYLLLIHKNHAIYRDCPLFCYVVKNNRIKQTKWKTL